MINNLAHALDRCDPEKPVRLLLRHGHRLPIPKGVFGAEVYLTEEGHQQAFAFGTKISHPLVSVVHSPIKRCGQTAEKIISGANQPQGTTEHPELFLAYFLSQEAGQTILANQPVRQTVEDLITGKPIEGLRSLAEGSKILLDLLFEKGEPGINLFVSHDLLICLLVHHLLGLSSYNPDLWPSFLEGIVFWEAQGTSYFSFNGKTEAFPQLD